VPLGYAALLKIIKKWCKIKGSKLGGNCLSSKSEQEKLIEFEERAKSLIIHFTNLHELCQDHATLPVCVLNPFLEGIKLYEALRNDVMSFFSGDLTVGSIPSAKNLEAKITYTVDPSPLIGRLLTILSYIDQMLGFLKGKKSVMLEGEKHSFPVDEDEFNLLPQSTQQLIMEAVSEYEYRHSYACCCICGLAFESLAKEGCKKYGLEYAGLANGIKALKEAGKIKEDLFKSLLDLEKYYRDKISAHVTSEIATDEKARLFLSALLSLGKALFPPPSDKANQ
jgi:hypothetical protein